MRKTYRIKDGQIIKGVSLPVFIHNMNYHLTDLNIYEDGKIDCWELVDFEGFLKKVQKGWVKTKLPKGERISAFPLGYIETKEFYHCRTEDELIKEVKDIINRFQGKDNSTDLCIKAYKTFKETPNQENRNYLKNAYEDVPAHNRRYLLGDMDVDDIPIKAIIYGDKVFKESRKAELQENYVRNYYLKGIEIQKS